MKKKDVDEDVEANWQKKDRAYVLFYASWCPFSQRFLPIFKEYEKTNPDECVEVMIDSKPNVCDKYEIEYYPTVLLFKKGKLQKRLDATPGLGLTKAQLKELTSNP
jgi:thiol-disulfide isomerase/thioredoxin